MYLQSSMQITNMVVIWGGGEELLCLPTKGQAKFMDTVLTEQCQLVEGGSNIAAGNLRQPNMAFSSTKGYVQYF